MPATNVKRGDIFWAELPGEESEGNEQHGRRPCLVMSPNFLNDRFNIAIVVPLSTKIQKANRQHRILIPESQKIGEPGTHGCPDDSVALCEQVRVISKSRMDNVSVAHLTPAAVASVEAGLAFVLGIP